MMTDAMRGAIQERLTKIPGEVSFYYKNLATGEEMAWNAAAPLVAASVIKLPIMIEAFRQMDCGMARADETFLLMANDHMPGCGVISLLHEGADPRLLDLVKLMIVVSDNTATNLLIRRLGMDPINRTMRDLGIRESTLRRLLFDQKASDEGVQNTVTAADMGRLLEMLYRGEILSPDASREMLRVLLGQQLNGKIPFYLKDLRIAHKTGEDEGITHDVGIVYDKEPFVAVFLSEKTHVPLFERTIQDISALLAGRETL